jgi:hypothetical protein
MRTFDATPYTPRTREIAQDDVRTNFSLVSDYKSPSSRKATLLASQSEKRSARKAASIRAMKAEHSHYSRNHKSAAKKQFDLMASKSHVFTVQEVREKAQEDYLATLAPPPPKPLPPPPPPSSPAPLSPPPSPSAPVELPSEFTETKSDNIFDVVTMPWEKTEKAKKNNKTRLRDIDERLSAQKFTNFPSKRATNNAPPSSPSLSPSFHSRLHQRHATSPADLARSNMKMYTKDQLLQEEFKQNTKHSPSTRSRAAPSTSSPSYSKSSRDIVDPRDYNDLNNSSNSGNATETIYDIQRAIDVLLRDIQQHQNHEDNSVQSSTAVSKKDGRRGVAVQRIADAVAHLTWLSKGSDSPKKAIARSELRIEVLPMLAATLEALVGRNDVFLSSPLPLTATLNELASVVTRAGELLHLKQHQDDGYENSLDNILHADGSRKHTRRASEVGDMSALRAQWRTMETREAVDPLLLSSADSASAPYTLPSFSSSSSLSSSSSSLT